MLKRLRLYSTFIFVSLFFLRIPPLYIFGIKNSAFTSHALSIVLFSSIFIFFLVELYHSKIKPGIYNKEFLLILTFLIFQSISVVGATNVPIFIQRYLKIVFGVIVYAVLKWIHLKDKGLSSKIARIFILGFSITLILQLILYLQPQFYFSLGNYLIYSNVFDVTKINFNIGKLFDDSYMEVAIPLIFFYLSQTRRLSGKISSVFLILFLGFVSFASNFRYRILTFVVSLFATMFLSIKLKRNYLYLILLFMALFYLLGKTDYLVRQQVGFSVVDRFLNENQLRDYDTISWRFKMFDKSVQMGMGNMFGVGLGNFYDNLPGNFVIRTNLPESSNSLSALEAGPHNIFFQIFAETGIFGLLSFTLLLLYFLRKDLAVFKERDDLKKSFSLSFWTLIFIGQFFPTNNLTFFSLFFVFRALI